MPDRMQAHTATGKRKSAVARVPLIGGSGQIVVNRRRVDEYFGRPTSRMIIQQPFELTGTAGQYDVTVNVCGGGVSAQAAAIRHGITRALIESNAELRPTLKRIDAYVIRWARRKFKRMRHQTKGARDWFDRLRRAKPALFAHWTLCHGNGRTSGAV